jgi:hypothetical protein
VREVIEVGRIGCCPVSDSLQVRECAKEGENSWKEPVAATELGDFRSGLLLKPKARELSSRRTI